MEGYRVDDYTAYAGGVFRDTKNELFVLDQLYIRTGIHIQVLSNSEHRFIGYKSVAFRQEFDEMSSRCRCRWWKPSDHLVFQWKSDHDTAYGLRNDAS